MELIDTHCHLDLEPLSLDVENVMARAQSAGVRHCLTIGTSVASSRRTVELAASRPMLRAAVGVHPHDADSVDEAALEAIDALAGRPEVVAIGEIGLDDYYPNSDFGNQARVLRRFLAIAVTHQLPVLIHCRGRESYRALPDILREAGEGVRGVIHCASGPPEFIGEALALGFYVSFAGNVTFKKADDLRTLVPLVPDDRLLIETDAPFLAPQPVRGKPNEPAFVAHTAAFLAELRGITLEALGSLTSSNARHLFRFPTTGKTGA